ncbi:MAG: hypothetical protein J7M32_05625 [Deltaproteobacteria bacterium]|nr:hypothetical protein [Deltaproteobacteria bacterium]
MTYDKSLKRPARRPGAEKNPPAPALRSLLSPRIIELIPFYYVFIGSLEPVRCESILMR